MFALHSRRAANLDIIRARAGVLFSLQALPSWTSSGVGRACVSFTSDPVEAAEGASLRPAINERNGVRPPPKEFLLERIDRKQEAKAPDDSNLHFTSTSPSQNMKEPIEENTRARQHENMLNLSADGPRGARCKTPVCSIGMTSKAAQKERRPSSHHKRAVAATVARDSSDARKQYHASTKIQAFTIRTGWKFDLG
ncbi:hypothetical protein AK812_SmicGene1765 [Symbiodinium microadriaticum]|uniref:Uncharacterized protein n=1 Tax=Symbiodinium microadriaticum TaxID=2951 RepID=A0A1Q9F387_SYMMI|nr:hypothetical protein AK812_SmicGene1765 [Symbiodinium microadriaticum]